MFQLWRVILIFLYVSELSKHNCLCALNKSLPEILKKSIPISLLVGIIDVLSNLFILNRWELQHVLASLHQLMLLSPLETLDLILPRLPSFRFIFKLPPTKFHFCFILTLFLFFNFQVLNIPTKINKGTVEIVTPVELIKKGNKVGSSEAALLSKLGIRPFSYGLVVITVYDNGSVFDPEVLDLTEDDLIEKFASGVSMVTSMSLAVSYPTLAAAPHMFING